MAAGDAGEDEGAPLVCTVCGHDVALRIQPNGWAVLDMASFRTRHGSCLDALRRRATAGV